MSADCERYFLLLTFALPVSLCDKAQFVFHSLGQRPIMDIRVLSAIKWVNVCICVSVSGATVPSLLQSTGISLFLVSPKNCLLPRCDSTLWSSFHFAHSWRSNYWISTLLVSLNCSAIRKAQKWRFLTVTIVIWWALSKEESQRGNICNLADA